MFKLNSDIMLKFFKSLFIILLSLCASVVLFALIIGGVIIGSVSYFAPSVEAPKRGSVLEINMSEEISDSPRQLPLFNLRKLSIEESSPLSLLSVLRAIEGAADDPNITALSLRLDGEYRLPLALAEELRGALERFRKSSGKPIYSYSQSYTQSNYYLATVADSLFLEPLGEIEWQGVAINSYYYGDLLRELGVGVEAFRPEACRYKSAVEPYLLSSQSEESREQSQRLVDELWRGVVGEVAEARGVDVAQLKSLAQSEILISSEVALRQHLIDRIAYRDQYDAALERCGVVRKKRGELQRISLLNYSLLQQQNLDLAAVESGGDGGNKVAVIYADGVIMSGRSEGGNDPVVGSQTLCSMLRRARADKSIKSVVLRVNSPGGSALAADVMWREVDLLQKTKPVIVSMGSYAASGGYYISAPADMIIADNYTLTGSIGVYGLLFNYAESLSKNLKINIDGVGSEPSADFGRTPRKLNAAERSALNRSVDEIYTSFSDKVASGRNLPIGVVGNISGGKVWSGKEAVACGLADDNGGLHKAIALAIERSSLKKGDYQIIEMDQERSGLQMLYSMVGAQINALTPKELQQLTLTQKQKSGLIMQIPNIVWF
ncbi:MAG: signal peptide peptidase SppA [Rikenellaceae bacterium]